MPVKNRLTFAYALSGLLAVLLIFSSVARLLYGGLWRRKAWGYVLGGLLLVKAAATGFTMAFTTALGAWWERAIDPFQTFLFVLFALMTLGALSLLVPYLRNIEESGSRPCLAGDPPTPAKGGLR